MAKRKDISSGNAEPVVSSDPVSPAVADAAVDAAAIETAIAAAMVEEPKFTPPVGAVEPPTAATAKPASPDPVDNSAPSLTASAPARRFLHLAAAVALAAALGAVLGSLGSTGIAHLSSAFSTSAAASNNSFAGDTRALRQLTAKLAADVAALKRSIEATTRSTNSHFAKLADRVEHAQAAPAAKLAKITETLDRLERRVAADITGSIAKRQATSTQPKQQDKPPVVTGWVLRDIFDGRALVESRHGIYEVGPGADLPGLGRVQTIRRQDGRWVVVTSKGLIVSAR